tara:strand:+ start:417 stop:638 length:222 start_codon:yes stop_codon:yes gene_type:complete
MEDILVKKIEIDDKMRSYTQYRLGAVTIKEVMDKYPDKVVDVYSEGDTAVLVLDTCRIKFTKEEINKGAEDGN